jgi:hypothetical protein
MSSILYVEVVAKEGERLTFLLASIQTYENFVDSPTLAAQLILESWVAMRRGRLTPTTLARGNGGFYCPFPSEEAMARAAGSPIAEWMPHQRDELRLVEEDFIREVAERIIRSTRVLERRHCNRRFRHLHAPRPEGLFEVEVVAAAWIGHLEPGVCWDSTAYPYEPGW